MHLLVYLFAISFYLVLEAFAYFSDTHNENSKSKFPFQNYYLVSTHLSEFKQRASKAKRDVHFNECINLNFSGRHYKMCIMPRNISDMNNGIVNKNTKFIIYNQNSKNTYKLNQLNMQFVRGYIVDKPYTSTFSGYVNNNNVYGKMEMGSQMFYIDPIDNFTCLMSNQTTKNAVIYEIPVTQEKLLNLNWNKALHKMFYSRSKRNIAATTGKTCSLLILIDNSFLRIIGKNNIKAAITRVLHSLDLTNALFRITDFNNDGSPDNIGFTTKYVIVLESEDTGMNKLPLYTKHPIDGKLYLFFLSQYELLAEVCLGVAFSAQPFMYRVLGLSYTGVTEDFIYMVPTNNSGGICERPGRLEGQGSFNNLVITYRLENDESVPQITSDLSLAHELGHSFGSDHDKTPKCMGYLMAPHTFNNTYGHNFLFSNCSKKQISEVVEYKGSCLEMNTDPFCGNGLTEGNEECDCGLTFTCIQKDKCCIPRNSKGSPCTVNKDAGFECHPSQGLCCTSDCHYRNISYLGLSCENFQRKCTCNSLNENCPCGILGSCVEDKCYSAECTRIGLTECRCEDYSKREQKCITCCLGLDQKCLPAKILTKEFALEGEINIDKLMPYSISSQKKLSTYTETSESYCIDSKCVNLLFRSFNKGSFCLFRGGLGICQDNYACIIDTEVWSKLPETRKITVLNSANYHFRNLNDYSVLHILCAVIFFM